MRTIDDEKEKEKEKVREVQKEKKPLKSLANGIKSLRISVPRFPLTIINIHNPILIREGLSF